MASFQEISLIGNLGQDPESRAIGNGKKVCNFSVAVTEKFKDEQKTTWFRISAWDKLGEVAQQYLTKGSQVFVKGRLSVNEYESNGEKRFSLEITASNLTMLGGGREKSEGESSKPAKSNTAEPEPELAEATDDLPF